MRTATINIYKFSELDDSAKERAKNDYAALFGYAWSEEALESICTLARRFGGYLTDYSIDWFACSPSSMSFHMPEMSKREIAARLRALGRYNRQTGKGYGECKLTGYCMDEDAIDGFRAAFRQGETDLRELMEAAFRTWLKSGQADCAASYEDEAFAEHCEVNGYEFYDDGSFAK